MLTQKELKELLSYDQITGKFTWLVRRGSVEPNTIAGSLNGKGYEQIRIGNKPYSSHRLVFLYMFGAFPIKVVDHVNGIKTDNRLQNLRQCSHAENCKGARNQSNNTSGTVGVCWHKKSNKWNAQIKVDGVRKHLGYFVKKSDAIAAREAANIKFGFTF